MNRRLAHWDPALYSWRKPSTNIPMTICLAAIGGNGVIFCAADRMKTGGDIEFEPKRVEPPPTLIPWLAGSKIFSASPSICAMTAGDAALQAELVQEAYLIIQARIKAQPENWWKVKDVVDVYVDCYDRTKRKRAESAVLAPFGLTVDAFIQNQTTMSASFISDIKAEMQGFDMPKIQTIITGVDEQGSHIYTVTNITTECNCVIKCHDTIGFAAIGSGARHATSQFMAMGYHRGSPTSEGLFLTYLAKKRAEIAPGVGKETNMFIIGPMLGVCAHVPNDIMKRIHGIFAGYRSSEKKAGKIAFAKAKTLEQKIIKEGRKRKQDDPSTATAKNVPPKSLSK